MPRVKARINFNVQEIENGFILETWIEGWGQVDKTFYPDLEAVAEAVENLGVKENVQD